MNENIVCPECDSDEIEPMEIDQDENVGYFLCTQCEHEFEADIGEEDY